MGVGVRVVSKERVDAIEYHRAHISSSIRARQAVGVESGSAVAEIRLVPCSHVSASVCASTNAGAQMCVMREVGVVDLLHAGM